MFKNFWKIRNLSSNFYSECIENILYLYIFFMKVEVECSFKNFLVLKKQIFENVKSKIKKKNVKLSLAMSYCGGYLY